MILSSSLWRENPNTDDKVRRAFLHSIHRTGEEAAALVNFTIVEPILGFVRFGINDEVDVTALEIQELKAARQRNDFAAAVLAQRHRLLRYVPTADFVASRSGAEHAPIKTIDPIETFLFDVPKRTFAQRRLNVDDDLMRIASSLISRLGVSRRSEVPEAPGRLAHEFRKGSLPRAAVVLAAHWSSHRRDISNIEVRAAECQTRRRLERQQ
jgi:hypothetical protein